METKKIELGYPLHVSRLTFIPITETLVIGLQTVGHASYFGTKRPLYILVIASDKSLKAFHVRGQETTLEKIASEYPEIKEELDTFGQAQ